MTAVAVLPYTEISTCRISGSTNLVPILSLGEQYLTGTFPKSRDEQITKGPLDLVWCPNSGLLQLKQTYDLHEMYGMNYGYRSGLNRAMVNHLQKKVAWLARLVPLRAGDCVVDIGSNDATLLKAYSANQVRIGIDPTGLKFQEYYTDGIYLLHNFFSAQGFQATFGLRGKLCPKIITSIAMFYDLERPLAFVQDVAEILADDGVWHFEQAYMPSMLSIGSYDVVCHEHLEFYSFTVVKKLIEQAGLRVIDVELNTINGGSFAVTVCKRDAPYLSNLWAIDWLLHNEQQAGLSISKPYLEFASRVFQHRTRLRGLLNNLVDSGKTVFGYGASTKGNVLLQFCGIGPYLVPYIAEVNEDKFGCFTPGTHIPIVPEQEARDMQPDYFLVLPWHFKQGILERESEFRARGGKFIFPLPEIEVV